MPLPDPYTAVHKMQRARLFGLTVAAGTLDGADAHARAELASAVEAMVDEIVAHGQHEERFVHPLLHRRAPDIAAELEQDHTLLDGRLDMLGQQARSFVEAPPNDPNDLYRALAAFSASYLAHVDREETAALPALWKHCTLDELERIFTEFHASRSATTNLASMFAMAPTLNPAERGHMLIGLGAVPPDDVADLLATVLTPGQFGALRLANLRCAP